MPRLRPETLPLRVLDVVRARALWDPGQTVLVAVSGGVDSLVLLDVLHRTAGAHGGNLVVQTLDHGLRPESSEDVALVRNAAEERGLCCTARRLFLDPGPDLMARARKARRAVWHASAADRIALGHHADDQAETVLQRLARGSGARGLSGMRPLAGRLARPLLFERKQTLRAYAEHRGLRWREDPSNRTSERGILRRLHTALEEIRPGHVAGLARSARLLAEDDDYLESLADGAERRCRRGTTLDLERLQGEPRPLAARVLLRWVAQVGHPVGAERLEAVMKAGPKEGTVELGGGWSVVVSGGAGRLVSSEER